MHILPLFALHVLRRLPVVATILCVACGASEPTPVSPKSIPVTYIVQTPQAIVIRAALPTVTAMPPTAIAASTAIAPTVAVPTVAVPTVAVTASELATAIPENTPVVAAPTSAPPTAASNTNADMPTQLVTLHNQVRANLGLNDYGVSAQLQQAAQRHAEWLAAKPLNELASLGDAGHTGEGGSKIADRVSRAGYQAESSSENWKFDADMQAAFTFWSTNPGHSPQVFSATFKEIGIGVAKHNSGSFVFVAVYAKQK